MRKQTQKTAKQPKSKNKKVKVRGTDEVDRCFIAMKEQPYIRQSTQCSFGRRCNFGHLEAPSFVLLTVSLGWPLIRPSSAATAVAVKTRRPKAGS